MRLQHRAGLLLKGTSQGVPWGFCENANSDSVGLELSRDCAFPTNSWVMLTLQAHRLLFEQQGQTGKRIRLKWKDLGGRVSGQLAASERAWPRSLTSLSSVSLSGRLVQALPPLGITEEPRVIALRKL